MSLRSIMQKCSLFLILLTSSPLLSEEISPIKQKTYTEVTLETIIDGIIPYRLLAEKDPKGHTLMLDDGSVWRAIDNSAAKTIATYWQKDDSLVLHPVLWQKWYGSRFYFYNERTQQAICVELSHGPLTNQATYCYIANIDYTTGALEVKDGVGRMSRWKLNSSQKGTYRYWKTGQTIILGSNEDCYAGWFSSHDYIIINVERDQMVEADLINL